MWLIRGMTKQRPRIFKDGETINALDTFESVEIQAAQLRTGMLVIDPELGCALWSVDHRVRSARNSGSVTWMVEDLENGGYKNVSLSPKAMIPVAVKS